MTIVVPGASGAADCFAGGLIHARVIAYLVSDDAHLITANRIHLR